MSNKFSDSQLIRAHIYIDVRSSQNVTRLDADGNAHAANVLSIDEAIKLLDIDKARVRNQARRY